MEGSQARIIRGDFTFNVETMMYKVKEDLRDSVIHKASIVLVDVYNPITSETIVVEVDMEDFIDE
jgi:hypothetical protein